MSSSKCKLEQLGYKAADYGLHSLRAGGATTAANAAVPDCPFKRRRSESAKDGYVDDSVESSLAVSGHVYTEMFSLKTTENAKRCYCFRYRLHGNESKRFCHCFSKSTPTFVFDHA